MQLVVNGALTYFEDIHPKASDCVVILPGWGQDSRHWTAFVSRLPSDFRYLVLDLPGFGKTQHLSSGAGLSEYVSWLQAFLEKTDLRKPILLGHSFGGQVATAFAARNSKDLQALLLLSPSALRDKSQKTRLIEQVYRHLRWVKQLTPPFVFDLLRPHLASDDYHNATAEQKKVLSKIILEDLRTALSKITVPTSIIWGEKDSEIPYAGKELAEKIPNSSLFVLYGADHSPQLTSPEKLAPVITEILENL